MRGEGKNERKVNQWVYKQRVGILKPCPFCGNTFLGRQEEARKLRIMCPYCGTVKTAKKEYAERDWNKRISCSEWISVKDRLPKDKSEVLFYDELCGIYIGWFDEEWQTEHFNCDSVTHWKPLPNPPERENKE